MKIEKASLNKNEAFFVLPLVIARNEAIASPPCHCEWDCVGLCGEANSSRSSAYDEFVSSFLLAMTWYFYVYIKAT